MKKIIIIPLLFIVFGFCKTYTKLPEGIETWDITIVQNLKNDKEKNLKARKDRFDYYYNQFMKREKAALQEKQPQKTRWYTGTTRQKVQAKLRKVENQIKEKVADIKALKALLARRQKPKSISISESKRKKRAADKEIEKINKQLDQMLEEAKNLLR